MDKTVYFSKVEFSSLIAYDGPSQIGYAAVGDMRRSIMLLNLKEKELSYQVFDETMQMPAIQGEESREMHGVFSVDNSSPARVIRNSKTNFEPKLIKSERYDSEVVFSYGIKLTDEQMEKILPYCNALDFEPYRNRKMSREDEGYIGYRDEVGMHFCAVTDSYIPKLELPMDYYYDEEHIWPSERLYRYLVATFFEGNKEVKGWGPHYGAGSLFDGMIMKALAANRYRH